MLQLVDEVLQLPAICARVAELPQSEGAHKRHQEERYTEVCSSSSMTALAGRGLAKQAQLLPVWPTPISKAGLECKVDSMHAALRPTYVGMSG